jgi:hypothetical protein
MVAMNAELAIGITTALVSGAAAVATQLWRLSDRLARLEERVLSQQSCCERLAVELRTLEERHSDHSTALARGGLL